jgi:hypothetical protein
MVKSSRGPRPSAKHFQSEDHAHAAHQQQARRGDVRLRAHRIESDKDQKQAETDHPMEQTPRGPKKGQ